MGAAGVRGSAPGLAHNGMPMWLIPVENNHPEYGIYAAAMKLFAV